MILSEEGILYLDKEKTIEYTFELFDSIYATLKENKVNKGFVEEITFTKEINKKTFTFHYDLFALFLINEEKVKINTRGIKIEFIVGKDDNKKSFVRHIFSFEQYKKNLEYFNISFPWSNQMIISDEKIKELIEVDISSEVMFLTIHDINFDKLIKPKINNFSKYKDLSIYISYYLKSEINIKKYEEKYFLDEKLFEIDSDSEFEIYDSKIKFNIYETINNCIYNNEKEVFFTGLHSIGKSFSLLVFNSIQQTNIRKAYFNLEILNERKNQNFFEIIIYESQNLFENSKEWEEAFYILKDKTNDAKNYLVIIAGLVELIISKYSNDNYKYLFILDQIKFKKMGDDEYEIIDKIRKLILNKDNFKLIGCCSINYKGVKDLLFYQWFKEEIKYEKKNNDFLNPPYISFLNNLQTDLQGNENLENIDKNEYLIQLGNLPRFKNIKEKLNQKIVNVFCKKIKEKMIKFYNIEQLYDYKQLEYIPVGKSFENNITFKKELEKIPFKYFQIYRIKNSFNYSLPIVKVAIKELIEEKEFEHYIATNDCAKGWIFEKKVIFKIRISHILSNKYYIDNSYLIPTIFLKHKVENLNPTQNSLFYFEFCNVKRYNAAIYFGDKKTLLLIQISTKMPRNILDEYNETNFQKDINEIQNFIKENNLKVNNYGLLFILDHEKYQKNEMNENIHDYDFSFYFFNSSKKEFYGELDSFYHIQLKNKIENYYTNLNNNKIFVFGKVNSSFEYNYKRKYNKYYAEKGMPLKRFFNEIFGDDISYEFFQNFMKTSEYYLLNDHGYTITHYYDNNIPKNNNIFLLNYENDTIIYGLGTNTMEKEITFYKYNIFSRNHNYVKKVSSYRCFIFIDNKIQYPKDD